MKALVWGYVVIIAIPLQTPEAPDAARGSHRSISSRHLCGSGTTPKINGRSARYRVQIDGGHGSRESKAVQICFAMFLGWGFWSP